MSRRSPLVIIAAGALLLLPLTAASCDDEPSAVRLGTAAVGDVEEIVEAPGTVTARTAATLTAPAAGTLTELRVESGDRVDKGGLLAVIDSPELEQRRDLAERSLDESDVVTVSSGTSGFAAVRHRTDEQAADAFEHAAAAADKIADPELKKALKHQITAARQQYAAASEAAGEAVRSVQRGVASLSRAVGALSAAQRLQAEQAYALADAAVEALSLRAPVGGTVQFGGVSQPSTPDLSTILEGGGSGVTQPAGVDSAVPEGAHVTAGTPILTVVDTSELGLSAAVDETDVLLVEPGVRAEAELDAAPGVVYPATVRSADLLPTTSARGGVSYTVRLSVGAAGDDAPRPLPGMSAVIRLKVREAGDAVTVPASAVISVDGRDTVWAVRRDRYESVPVTLGVQGDETVQVVRGISAGERIVVAGADQVTAGDEVP
ncbi:HlyD family efflux transporter periplasmic adaptor subunit [Actinoplanes missouriensis]|uniref:efflux RND transporter periplasmic adaptor subunit n=1 Tax=Actinoplanes missouriensis TaxID=1866 RepID=UPI0033E38B83